MDGARRQSKDLLYVSNSTTVTVYSYPQGKLEGRIRFGYLPGGECADQKGDVFITNLVTGQVLEYAHGGTKPIAILAEPERRSLRLLDRPDDG